MTPTLSAGIAHQLEVTFRSGSTYVVLAIASLLGLVASLPDAAISALVANVPFLKPYSAIIGATAIFFAAKLKPSSAVSAQTQAFIDEITRLRLNVALKAAGQAELPPKPSAAALPVSVPVMPTSAGVDLVLPPPAPPVDPMVAELRRLAPDADPAEVARVVALFRSSKATA